MNKLFSHLIWLGAGQAQEPSGLIAQAKQVTLVDARESACEYLKKQFPSDPVQVASKLITVHGGQQSFTEYNLPEYSALQATAGLKKLFPGLKIAHQETMSSVSLEQFFKELNLTDNKNALVVDLPDVNQAFLEALHKTSEFYKFNKLYVFANTEPLYLDALNASTIVNFLQSVGYLLQETISTDPDFPCLVFGANPLWIQLQQANHLNTKLASDAKELKTQQETLKQQLVESKQQIDLLVKERDSLKQQSTESKQQVDLVAKERESLKQQLSSQQQQKESQDKERETLKQQLAELKQKVDLVAKERESLKQQLAGQQQQKESQDKERETLKQQLAELKQKVDLVAKERESLKQQLAGQQQQKESQDKERETLKQQLAELKQQFASQQQQKDVQEKEQEKLKQKLAEEQKKLTEANGLLDQATKQSASRKDTVSKLEKEKRELEEVNKNLKLKQNLLEKELIKAEAQIELIKMLLVKA